MVLSYRLLIRILTGSARNFPSFFIFRISVLTSPNAQSFFPHASHPSIVHAAGVLLTPITAVTDFDGIIRYPSVRVIPILFPASRPSRISFCADSGKSPYPGENLGLR